MAVCKFFLRGDCKFGDRCRNEHPRGAGSGADNYGYGGEGGDTTGGDTTDGGGGFYDNGSQNYDGLGGGGGGGMSDQAVESFGQSDRNDDIKEHDIITESGRSPVSGSSGSGSTSTGFGSMSASFSPPVFGSSAFGNAPSAPTLQPSPGQTGGNAGAGLLGKPALDTTTDIGGKSEIFESSGQTDLFGKPDLSSDPTPSTFTPSRELTPEEKARFKGESFSNYRC